MASPRNPRQAALKRQRAVEVDEDTDEEMGGQQKGVVSHSTVEKRRRDRLNTLIDLLAEQVPPSSVKYTGEPLIYARWSLSRIYTSSHCGASSLGDFVR
jgi:hypothetical protein